MSLQSDHFENLLKELKAKGIADESSRIGAQELGRTVRDSIIAPFKVAVGTYAAKQDDVPPKTLKRSSSRKHMQTKKAKSAANKNFQPTSSTARIQDKVSLSMFGVPNSTNTTGIAINSGATVCASQSYNPRIFTRPYSILHLTQRFRTGIRPLHHLWLLNPPKCKHYPAKAAMKLPLLHHISLTRPALVDCSSSMSALIVFHQVRSRQAQLQKVIVLCQQAHISCPGNLVLSNLGTLVSTNWLSPSHSSLTCVKLM